MGAVRECNRSCRQCNRPGLNRQIIKVCVIANRDCGDSSTGETSTSTARNATYIRTLEVRTGNGLTVQIERPVVTEEGTVGQGLVQRDRGTVDDMEVVHRQRSRYRLCVRKRLARVVGRAVDKTFSTGNAINGVNPDATVLIPGCLACRHTLDQQAVDVQCRAAAATIVHDPNEHLPELNTARAGIPPEQGNHNGLVY